MARPLSGLDLSPVALLPPLPAGVHVGGLSASHDVLIQLERECHPPGHIDRDRALGLIADGSFRRLLDGELLGPVLPTASGQAEDERGNMIGAGIVVWWETADVWRGPWVADLCVRPAHQGRGIGSALLQRAIAACTALGAPRIGLAVTEGNRARSFYERFGFAPL